MTFAAVGSGVAIGSGATFALNPVTAGDLFIASLASESATIFATGITSTNVTWAQAGTSFEGVASGSGTYCNVWLGKASATGSATQTIAFSGTAPLVRGYAKEFSSTVGAWALDGSQGSLDATTATCPSLTPSQAGDIYWFYSLQAVNTVNGTTSGYTYFADANSNGGCYDAACTNAAQAPAFGNSSGRTGIAVLVKELTAAAPAYLARPQQAVVTAATR